MSALNFEGHKMAYLNWLEDDTTLLADLPGTVVTGRLPDKKGDAPGHLLTAQRGGGSNSQDNYPDHRPLLRVMCYGSKPHAAAELAGAVLSLSLPLPPAVAGFRKGGVCCNNIALVSDMFESVDPRLGWPVCIFVVRLDINPGVQP